VNEFYVFQQELLHPPVNYQPRIADILTVKFTLNHDYFRK